MPRNGHAREVPHHHACPAVAHLLALAIRIGIDEHWLGSAHGLDPWARAHTTLLLYTTLQLVLLEGLKVNRDVSQQHSVIGHLCLCAAHRYPWTLSIGQPFGSLGFSWKDSPK